MVDLHLRDNELEIEVQGTHKLWAFKRRIAVPLAAISAVRRVSPWAVFGWWKGWRVPGTHVPGIIVAGTYYKDGERHFWDMKRGDQAIELELRGADYDRLFVAVDDPDEAIAMLKRAQS